MKKALKVIGIIFACLIVLGNLAKNITRPIYENSFASQVERANRGCPIPVGLGNGAVTAIRLEKGFLTYYLSYDTPFYNLMSGLSPEKVKEALVMCFLCANGQGDNQGNVMMDKLIKENCGLKIVITNSAQGKTEYSATVQEIQSLRKRYQLNPQEAMCNMLTLSLEAERMSLPMKIEEGLYLTDYRLEGEDIVITAMMDESIYSIETLQENKEMVKNSIWEDVNNDADMKALFDMCKVSHTGLVYRYVGDQSRKQCNIRFSSREIRAKIITPANAHVH
jgi:hypothetical protein